MNKSFRFYDIHCHAMNLSHPNFVLFIKRLAFFHGGGSFDDLCVVLKQARIAMRKGERNNRIMNLLSVMERDIGELLALMEKDLLELRQAGQLRVGGSAVGTVVLTPLMIDFGRKNINDYPGIYYNELSRKPIRDQVVDLFNGIRDHRERAGKGERFLEIYPFLGLNTANYELESDEKSIGLKELLNMYFSGFKKGELDQRRQRLSEKTGTFTEADKDKSYSCAGIKVYPPLGFDPWPIAGSRGKKSVRKEQDKVEYLYEFCVDRDIPITAHCNDSGFMADNVPIEKFTAPSRWGEVLRDKKFEKLKLNLAHFGRQDRCCAKMKNWMRWKTPWWKDAVELILGYDNVYSDFSYIGTTESWYNALRQLLDEHAGRPEDHDKLKSRILFGSDFMINLLATRSYKDYVGLFLGKNALHEQEKRRFCSENPEEFLFGKKDAVK